MPSTDEALAPARAAVAAGAWSAAMDALRRLPDPEPVPERLELLAAAAYGTGDLEATLTSWESVHAIHLQRGELVQAARAAAMVGMYLMMDTGLMAPVRGWLSRVDRLLEDHDETPVHGLVAMIRAYERLMSGDLGLAGSWARRAVDLGDRHGVVPASTLGRVAAARVRIFDGDVTEGLGMLDDVAVMLMSGQVDPLTTGMVYCELICAMQGLGEYTRADEWTRAMDAVRDTGAFFGGINGRCRVHRAEMLRLRGQCAEAEDEALHACEELRPWMRREFGWPLTELGTIRLRRGDFAGAEEAFRAAHHGGWEPQPGLALLRLAQGDADTAMSMVRDALERPMQIPWKERPPVGGLSRAPLLEACVPIAIAAADLDTAERATNELADLAKVYGGDAIRAVADLAVARTAVARHDPDVAVPAGRAAVEAWCTIGAPYEAATARLVLAAALRLAGNDDVALIEEDAAATTLREIGAVPIGDATPPVQATPPTSPTADAAASAVFRRDQQIRTIAFAGRSAVLRDLKGMRYLERLLEQPGREFHALDLVAVEVGSLPTAGHTGGDDRLAPANDHSGPVIDEEARRAYRRRLDEIEQDIAEAERLGDSERIAMATFDRDFIVGELSRAFGLGGRARTAGSTSERARVSVTRAIRYALSRIAEQHPELAEHLKTTITTGMYCSYRPDPRVPIAWDT
jgi:tetratricopeptide (TPR) repeat protein